MSDHPDHPRRARTLDASARERPRTSPGRTRGGLTDRRLAAEPLGGGAAATIAPDGPCERAIGMLARSQAVLLVDERQRWPAHVIVAASRCRPDDVALMARAARGLVSLALAAEWCDRLGLRPMGGAAASAGRLRYTVSIEARDGVTTGISAADRARTIAAAIDPRSGPLDLVSPGHVFPVRADDGGLRAFRGPAEAAIELVQRAGCGPAAVICAVLDDQGDVAAAPHLDAMADQLDLAAVTIGEVEALTSDVTTA